MQQDLSIKYLIASNNFYPTMSTSLAFRSHVINTHRMKPIVHISKLHWVSGGIMHYILKYLCLIVNVRKSKNGMKHAFIWG